MSDDLSPSALPLDPSGDHESDAEEQLLLELDGYSGPIDMMLDLARKQKLDLMHISILELARQYLNFIERAQDLQLDLAAEYLVMAAWLAYLKSRLLLPSEETDEDELSGEEMAAALAFQLRRLEAMQNAADDIFTRPQLGQHVFARGMGHDLSQETDTKYDASLYDLLASYGAINRRRNAAHYKPLDFHLMSMDDAMDKIKSAFSKLPRKGKYSAWLTLDSLVEREENDLLYSRSSVASLFTAGLEMAKYGSCDIRQDAPLKPIYMRKSFEPPRPPQIDDNKEDSV